MNKYIRRMPRELIHIISSYAHSPQPRELCYDIRLYKQDMNIIDSFYHTQYTPGILLHDLMVFYGYIGYHNILTRHFMLSRHSVDDIDEYVGRHLAPTHDVLRKCNFLWGLLSPIERTRFINDFIVDSPEN